MRLRFEENRYQNRDRNGLRRLDQIRNTQDDAVLIAPGFSTSLVEHLQKRPKNSVNIESKAPSRTVSFMKHNQNVLLGLLGLFQSDFPDTFVKRDGTEVNKQAAISGLTNQIFKHKNPLFALSGKTTPQLLKVILYGHDNATGGLQNGRTKEKSGYMSTKSKNAS